MASFFKFPKFHCNEKLGPCNLSRERLNKNICVCSIHTLDYICNLLISTNGRN